MLTIPGYEILSEVSNVNDMVVYKARDLRLGWVVAVKVCRRTDSLSRSRFLHGVQCMAYMGGATGTHSPITAIYSTDVCSHGPFLTMEFVDGGRLADQVGAAWPARKAAELFKHVVEAVQAMSAKGIVHREIHPWHILLTPD